MPRLVKESSALVFQTETPIAAPQKKKMRKWKVVAGFFVFFFIIAGYGTAFYFYKNYQILKKNPVVEDQEESRRLVNEVGKLMRLPDNETPTIATVSNKDEVKTQEFFKQAENGDKLLAFVKSKKAILYRPSEKRIIEVAPIFLNDDDKEKQSESSKDTAKTTSE